MKTLDQSYYCGASTTQIIYETIGVYFDRICNQYPDKDALIVRHQDVRWTYRELQEKVDALAVGLLSLGAGAGAGAGDEHKEEQEQKERESAVAVAGAVDLDVVAPPLPQANKRDKKVAPKRVVNLLDSDSD